MPDNVYNWFVQVFHGHSNCTRYGGQMSPLMDISASIVRCSAIGWAVCVAQASELVSVTSGNSLCKYADDMYLLILTCNCHSWSAELDHVDSSARCNSLHLNRATCADIVFTQARRHHTFNPSPCLPDFSCVSSIKILGWCHYNQQVVSHASV